MKSKFQNQILNFQEHFTKVKQELETISQEKLSFIKINEQLSNENQSLKNQIKQLQILNINTDENQSQEVQDLAKRAQQLQEYN